MHRTAYEATKALPVIFDAYGSYLTRRNLALGFIGSWTLTIVALLGLLGDFIQTVFSILLVIWFIGVGAAHKNGLLKPGLLFWAAVFGIANRHKR